MNQLMEKLYQGEHLSKQDTHSIIENIVTGQLSEAEISAFLVALKIKGEWGIIKCKYIKVGFCGFLKFLIWSLCNSSEAYVPL